PGFHDLRIAGIFSPSAAAKNRLGGIKTVGRVADGERARDGLRLLRLNLIASGFHGHADWAAAGGLSAKELDLLFFYEFKVDQLFESFVDLGDQRSTSHRNNDVVRQTPAQLFGDFITY